jgi:hypothetical protein
LKTVLFQDFQQRTLNEDGIAGAQLQHSEALDKLGFYAKFQPQ